MRRTRIYYPKTKITNNLYTDGKEWMLEDGTEYIGYYHKYLDGKVLTEAVFNDVESKKLIPYVDITIQPVNYVYNTLKNVKTLKVESPVSVVVIPSIEDYTNGSFKRHFIYRRNLTDIFQNFYEVNEDQYKSWKKPKSGIDEIIYDAFVIDWKLTGPLRDIVIDGRIKEFGVYDTNRRLVYLFNNDYPKINLILTDYTEFSIYSNLTPQEIKKQFGA